MVSRLMPEPQRFREPPPTRPPICPACREPMSVGCAAPDEHFINVRRVLFVCD
jgi:hypothetical protein